MHRFATLTTLVAAAILATAQVARAAQVFTWNPAAAGLAGSAFTADRFNLGDHAEIVTSNGGLLFTDTGYMPLLGFSLNGQGIDPAGFDNPDGTGWGAFIHYTAAGTQTLSPLGYPASATFTQLSYEIVGYNGLATFSFDANGAPMVGGNMSNATTLLSGSLVSGQLAYLPVTSAGLSIIGTVLATVDQVLVGFSPDDFGWLEVNFIHGPDAYAFTSPNTIQISDGGLSNGGLVSVPEPASLLLLSASVLAFAGLGRIKKRAPSSTHEPQPE